MNYKSILFFLGVIFILVSLFSVLNIFYTIYFQTLFHIDSYIITLLLSLSLGTVFIYVGRNDYKNTSISEQILFVIISFILLPLIISIPFYLSVYDINLLDSYFESVSGVTTTGFSIIEDKEIIDKPLLLWRSSSQWLGGFLFLVATIGTLGSRQIKIRPSFLIEGGTEGRNFYNEFKYNFIKILLIYFFSTLFIVFLYTLLDIRLLDSLNLAFTVISSGGFISSNNLSDILIKDSQIFLLSLTLLFPILNFYLLFNILTKNFETKKYQEDLHILILITSLVLIVYFFIIPDEKFINVLLAIITSISTSGLSTNSLNFDLSLLLILLTLVGGSLISTSSGFKYVRIYILFKISFQEIYKLVKPINIFNKNLFKTDTKIDDEDSKIAFLIFILLIMSLFILSSVLTLDSLSFENSFKMSVLTLTNTVTSPLYLKENISFIDLSNLSKGSLILFMVLGRIEIIAVLYLLKRYLVKG